MPTIDDGPLFSTEKTFKPQTQHRDGTQRYRLHKFCKPLIGTGDLHATVKLPPDTDLDLWLCVHTVDFFNITNILYGSVTEYCTDQSCPVMSAGPRFEYLWRDKGSKKPQKVTARTYMFNLMSWIEEIVNDESKFPNDDAKPFPPNFRKIVSDICRRLLRVYAHIYYFHLEPVEQLNQEPHLNTAFKHFFLYCSEFNLVEANEIAPLADLIRRMMGPQALAKFGDSFSPR